MRGLPPATRPASLASSSTTSTRTAGRSHGCQSRMSNQKCTARPGHLTGVTTATRAGKLPKELGLVNALDCRADNELFIGEL